MKKFFYLFIITCFLLLISSCETTNKLVSELTIISVNDFHGALDESDGKYGVARLANSISAETKNSEASILVSAGDMFQGTALSNYDHGKTVIDIMNKMKFDAMVIGNHEFDWGYEEIYKYVDGNDDNGEATFPFLGCNIIEKSTGQRPVGIDAYQIIKRGGLKIAIVGYMGEGNESDIAEAMIKDYEFANPISYIKSTISDLRINQGVDVVIVSGHEGNGSNQMLASLAGDERVDAIINAHTHSTYSGTITRSDGVKIPYVQAGSAGEKFGLMKLSIDQNTKK
ncbi:MAG: bifunctional metallophosphatase/5'-nucleotidase [Bacilli bacterium]